MRHPDKSGTCLSKYIHIINVQIQTNTFLQTFLKYKKTTVFAKYSPLSNKSIEDDLDPGVSGLLFKILLAIKMNFSTLNAVALITKRFNNVTQQFA